MARKSPTVSLGPALMRQLLRPVRRAGAAFMRAYPGEPLGRQPVHSVYGGAQLFRSDSVPKLGALALKAFAEHAPSAGAFAAAIGLEGPDGTPPADFANTIHARVKAKLEREPVEDFRIDFEDGYGNRPDAEEDGHAEGTAREVARGMKDATLPPFIGIRIKPLSPELAERALRTLDLFVTTLVHEARRLPPGFVVTLPKVTMPEQVSALVRALAALERRARLAKGSLRLELMVETTQAVLNGRGVAALPALVEAAEGRCVGAHFGTYDYTAACRITAAHQTMTHPACEFAKQVMQVVLAGTGVQLSDGATNVMPVGPHRAEPGGPPLTPEQQLKNRAAVHRAWQLHFADVRSSLRNGYYQGWDLHPAQLVSRFAAVYGWLLPHLDDATSRVRAWREGAATAGVLDEPATVSSLLRYLRFVVSSGAVDEAEILEATGLARNELFGNGQGTR